MSTPKPQDRFTRLVQQVEMYAGDIWYQTPCVSSVDTKKLLKAEHAAVVRLVTRLRHRHMVGSTRVVEEADFNYAFMAACDEILTALAARGRGKG